MRLIVVRSLAVLCSLTWLLLPGFGLLDLSVTWDPDWAVVLEASWGLFMTVLVGGSFLAVAARPHAAAPAWMTLLVAEAALLLSAAVGLEWQLLGLAALLAGEGAVLFVLTRRLPAHERIRPMHWSLSAPLLVLAVLGVMPWLLHAWDMWAANRRGAGETIGELTMGIDHYAVQGGLAVALVALSLLAACWPRGRRHLGVSTGLCAGYLGLVSVAFPGTWAGFTPLWSWLSIAWGVAVALVAVVPRLQLRELRREVVEAQ